MFGFIATLDKRRVALIVLTLLIAFAAGEVVQQDAVREEMARSGNAPAAAPIVETERGTRALPVPPAATLRPLDPPPILPERVQEAEPDSLDEVRFSPYGQPCDPAVDVQATPSTGLRISLPCAGWRSVVVTGGAFERRLLLDRFGSGYLSIPLRQMPEMLDLRVGDLRWRVHFGADYATAQFTTRLDDH